MASPSLRRSDRVSLTLLIEVSGKDGRGEDFKETSRTLLINQTGAVIIVNRDLKTDQEIQVRRQAPSEAHRQGVVRVVGQFGREKDGFLYGVEILNSNTDLWGIEFPPIAESDEAVARMLLECNYCRAQEVVYLNELELRGFESNRGIARHCKACGVPSIWTQAPHEDEKRMASRAARSRRRSEAAGEPPASGEQRERERIRVQTRLT